MGIMNNNPKNEPMHYGEAFGIWSYLLASKGGLSAYQTYMNHTGDKELKKMLEDMVTNVLKPEIEQMEDFLKENGIGLPPGPPEKPKASLEDIPVGARIEDPEIAAAISMNTATGLIACSQIMAMSIREDIAMMFGKFHMTKAQNGANLLRLNKEKGWLVMPPLHQKTPEYAEV